MRTVCCPDGKHYQNFTHTLIHSYTNAHAHAGEMVMATGHGGKNMCSTNYVVPPGN